MNIRLMKRESRRNANNQRRDRVSVPFNRSYVYICRAKVYTLMLINLIKTYCDIFLPIFLFILKIDVILTSYRRSYNDRA